MISLPTCPICSKSVPPTTDPGAGYSPFCSLRCKQVDLMRWCDGRYAIVESVDPQRLAEIQPDPLSVETDDEYSDVE